MLIHTNSSYFKKWRKLTLHRDENRNLPQLCQDKAYVIDYNMKGELTLFIAFSQNLLLMQVDAL